MRSKRNLPENRLFIANVLQIVDTRQSCVSHIYSQHSTALASNEKNRSLFLSFPSFVSENWNCSDVSVTLREEKKERKNNSHFYILEWINSTLKSIDLKKLCCALVKKKHEQVEISEIYLNAV